MGLFGFLKKNDLDSAPALPMDDVGIPPPPSGPKMESMLAPIGEFQIQEPAHIPSIPTTNEVPDTIPDLELPDVPIDVSKEVVNFEPVKQAPITGPLFLQISNFKESMIGLTNAKESLRNSQSHFDDAMIIKNEQDKIFENLRLTIEDMERKLLYVDKTLFEGESHE